MNGKRAGLPNDVEFKEGGRDALQIECKGRVGIEFNLLFLLINQLTYFNAYLVVYALISLLSEHD